MSPVIVVVVPVPVWALLVQLPQSLLLVLPLQVRSELLVQARYCTS